MAIVKLILNSRNDINKLIDTVNIRLTEHLYICQGNVFEKVNAPDKRKQQQEITRHLLPFLCYSVLLLMKF